MIKIVKYGKGDLEEGNWMEKVFPLIETERLILREVIIEDANDMFKYLSDMDVVKPM